MIKIKKIFNIIMNIFSNKYINATLFCLAYILLIYFSIKNPSSPIANLPQYLKLSHYEIFLIMHIISLFTAIMYLNSIKLNKNFQHIIKNIQYFFELLRYKASGKIPGIKLKIFFYRYFEYFVISEIHVETFVKAQILLFHAFPCILVAIIFIVDVAFYKKIHYFLFSIFLLIIPILWKIFVILLRDYSVRTLRIIENIYNVAPSGELLSSGFYEKYTLEKKPELFYGNLDIEAFSITRAMCAELYCYVDLHVIPYYNKIKKYVTVLTSILYIIGLIQIIQAMPQV